MDYSKKTKKQLIDDIAVLNSDCANVRKKYEYIQKSLKTVEMLYNTSQLLLKASTEVSNNLMILLTQECKDSEVLLKIQSQLIVMIDGRVWICPKCGKVAKAAQGPNLVMCSDCIN